MNIIKRGFVTGLFTGYSPIVPGTCGTAVATGITLASMYFFGSAAIYINIVLFLILLYPGIHYSFEAETFFGEKDPQKVVIDEILGYFLAIIFHVLTIKLVIAAFVLFRIFDIIKPWPVKQVQKFKGGYGIVVDDLAAGIYVNIILCAVLLIQHYAGLNLL